MVSAETVLHNLSIGTLIALGFSATLIVGCVVPSESERTKMDDFVTEESSNKFEHKRPNKGFQYDIIHQYELEPNIVFNFNNLPRRKISAPTGDVYIADHTQNPEYLRAIQDRIDYIANDNKEKNYANIGSRMMRVKYIQMNDVLRAGCMKMVDSDCNLNSYNYKKSCENEHNFGSNLLSDCELENLNDIQNQAIASNSCLIDGKIHMPESIQTAKTVDQIARHELKFMCLEWRR